MPVGAWLLILVVLDLPLLVVSTARTHYIGGTEELWLYNCDDTREVDFEFNDDACGIIWCRSQLVQYTFTEQRRIYVEAYINGSFLPASDIIEMLPQIEAELDSGRYDFGEIRNIMPFTAEVEFDHADPIFRILWYRIISLVGFLIIASVQLWLLVTWIRNLHFDFRRARRKAALVDARCPCCNYDIRQLAEHRCPECGESWNENEVVSAPITEA